MPDYQIFGRLLRSELPFPEVTPASAHAQDPSLTLCRGLPEDLPPTPSERPLGETTVGDGATVRLFRDRAGLLLEISDTGTFRISDREIVWWPGPEGESEALRVDLKGRVLPLALHLSDTLCLHSGAVAIGGEAIALTGPKRVGKSTLTAALVAAGADFLTDDVLALSPPPNLNALPGFDSFRLWRDSADHIPLHSSYRQPGLGGKLNVRAPSVDDKSEREPTSLAAVYLLHPGDPTALESAVRRRLPESVAAVALVGSVKNGEILGGSEQTRTFALVSQCARSVPCFALGVPRDLDLLGRTAAEILAWHSGTGDSE